MSLTKLLLIGRILLMAALSVPSFAANDLHFLWSKQFVEGSGGSFPFIVSDAAGNVYLAGDFQGRAVFGATAVTSSGTYRGVYVVKMTPLGDVVWAKSFGGLSGDTFCTGLAIDTSANLYFGGSFSGGLTIGSAFLTASGTQDIYFSKLNSDGAPVYAKKIGGSGYRAALSVAVSPAGELFVSGLFDSALTFGGSTLTPVAGNANLFIAKADATGAFVWAHSASGNIYPFGRLRTDNGGNVFVGGSGFDTLTFGSITSSNTGEPAFSESPYVAKYDSNGVLQWLTRPIGTPDRLYSLDVDANGNVLFSGRFRGALTFPEGSIHNSAVTVLPFAVTLDSAGKFVSGKTFAATTTGDAYTFLAAPDGSTFVAGNFTGTYSDPIALAATNGSAVVFSFAQDGTLQSVNQFAGTNAIINSATVDAFGNLLLAGHFTVPAFFGDSFRNPAGGPLFIVKLGTNLPPNIVASPVATTVETSETIRLTAVGAGSGQVSYKWYRTTVSSGVTNEVAIANATNSVLLLSPAAISNTGFYWCEITDENGSVLTARAAVQVGRIPLIVTAPSDVFVPTGSALTLPVIADGSATLKYQWYRDYQGAISKQTSNSVTLTNIQPSIYSSYYNVITNLAGSAVSPTIRVAVYNPSATNLPISVSGWNRDVVLENSATPSSQFFDVPDAFAWFEAGLSGHYDGLPSSRVVPSVANTNTVFQLQRYDAPNVLWLGSAATNNVASLTVDSPRAFSSLAFLGADVTSFASSPTIYLHFDDGTITPITLTTIGNWWPSTTNGLAIGGFGYASYVPGSTTRFTLGRASVAASDGLYEADVNLISRGLDTKTLVSITFSNSGNLSGVGIFAVSGASANTKPFVLSSPAAVHATTGDTVTLAPAVAGPSLSFQWFRDATPIPTQTSATLTLTNVQVSDSDTYRLEVSNPGNVVSVGINVVVDPLAAPSFSGELNLDGTLTLDITTQPNHIYSVETSVDLVTWTPYRVFTNATSTAPLFDNQAPFRPQRFFRSSAR